MSVKIPQEPDVPAVGRLILVGVVVLLVLGVGVLWSWWVLVRAEAGEGVAARERTAAGIARAHREGVSIDESLVHAAEPGPALRRRQRAVLESYGWVDRDAGIARVPVTVGMERLARGALR